MRRSWPRRRHLEGGMRNSTVRRAIMRHGLEQLLRALTHGPIGLAHKGREVGRKILRPEELLTSLLRRASLSCMQRLLLSLANIGVCKWVGD